MDRCATRFVIFATLVDHREILSGIFLSTFTWIVWPFFFIFWTIRQMMLRNLTHLVRSRIFFWVLRSLERSIEWGPRRAYWTKRPARSQQPDVYLEPKWLRWLFSSCVSKKRGRNGAKLLLFSSGANSVELAPKRAPNKKGLRGRNSPMCTLSQNGYGDEMALSFRYSLALDSRRFWMTGDGLRLGQWHPWSSGYDVSLTRWRSPVRSWLGVW